MTTVRDELVAVGGVPEGQFNQSSFTPFDQVEGADISGGYCAGVVLDWTRRVLQSAPDRDASYLNYSAAGYGDDRPDGVQSKQAATTRRMATAYAGQGSSYVQTTHKEATIAALRALLGGVEGTTSTYGTGVPVPHATAQMLSQYWEMTGGSFARFNLGMDPAGRLTLAKIGELITDLIARPEAQAVAGAAGGRQWPSFAASLDTRFRQIRIADGKQVDPNKLFSNLRVVRSAPSTPYASGGAWMAALIDNGFMQDGCTTLSFKPTTGGSGHQLAVHQTAADSFRLFDPNYGVFRYSRANLQRVFQHLFWARIAVADANAVDRDKAVYLRRKRATDPEIGTWDRMAYTIFQRV